MTDPGAIEGRDADSADREERSVDQGARNLQNRFGGGVRVSGRTAAPYVHGGV